MKGCAHASTDDFGVVVVDGWRNNADVLNSKGGCGAHDGAEVASVGWINEEKVVGFRVELAMSLFELSNKKAGVFGGQDIKWLSRFDDLDMFFGGELQDFLDIFAVFFGRAEEDLRDDFWFGFEKFKN